MVSAKTSLGASGVVKFFASPRLTVVLLIVIAGLAFFSVLGKLPDVHHTRYFNFLLGLLFINLLICTLDRFPPVWRRIRLDSQSQAPPPPREPDFIIRVQSSDPSSALSDAEGVLFGRPGARRELARPSPAPRLSVAETLLSPALVSFRSRGKWSLLGPHLTHLGILLIIIGAIIGGRYTVEGGVWLKPGEESSHLEGPGGSLIAVGFTVRCNDFQMLMNPDGVGVQSWQADLSILEGGTEAVRQVIEVNRPLSYRGFGIYQSDWRPDRSGRVQLTATSLEDGSSVSRALGVDEPWHLSETGVSPPLDTEASAPETGESLPASFMIVDHEPHSSYLGQDLGRRLVVIRYQGEEPVEELTLFERRPGFDPYYRSGLAFLEPGDETDELKSYFFQIPIALGFTVRLNEFEAPGGGDGPVSGSPRAEVSVLEDGEEKIRSWATQEGPLRYGDYLILPGLIEAEPRFLLTAARVADGSSVSAELGLFDPWPLPGSSVSFTIVAYERNVSGMGRDLGTRLVVRKDDRGKPVAEFFLFEKSPGFDKMRGGEHQLSFQSPPAPARPSLFLIREDESADRLGPYELSFSPLLVTGLRFVRDPGTPVTWTGSGLLAFGVMLGLFIHHRRLWLVAVNSEAGVEIRLIGRTRKAKAMFRSDLENQARKLALELKGDIISPLPETEAPEDDHAQSSARD